MTDFIHGFQIQGSVRSGRKPVAWADTFARYARADEDVGAGEEGYLSAFAFGEDFIEHIARHGSVKGFDGDVVGDWLWLDLDRTPEQGGLEAAFADALRLVQQLEDRLGVDPDDLLVFFSGSKGAHVGVPLTGVRPTPGPTFNAVARRFAEGLAADAGAQIDTAVYDKVRPFRAPNSRHPDTGLCKIRLSVEELQAGDVERIKELAERPRPFDVPAVTAVSERLIEAWRAAEQAVPRPRTCTADLGIGEPGHRRNGRLHAATIDFLRGGAPEGERNQRVFRATADLLGHGAPLELCEQLLEPPARQAGLPDHEIRRTIENAAEHVRRHPESAGVTPRPLIVSGNDAFASWRERIERAEPKPRLRAGEGELAHLELAPGSITILGGKPGAGKSCLGMQAVAAALRIHEDLRAHVVSVEMHPDELLSRLLARFSGVDLAMINDGSAMKDYAERIDYGLSELGKITDRMTFAQGPYLIEDIESQARRLRADGPLLLLADYAQRILARGRNGDPRINMEQVMEGMRAIAKQDTAVLVVSALARGKSSSGRSSYEPDALDLASLRDSSELEYGADNVYLLKPQDDGDDEAAADRVKLEHVKARHSARRSLDLRFDKRRQSFGSWAAAAGPTAELADDDRGDGPDDLEDLADEFVDGEEVRCD